MSNDEINTVRENFALSQIGVILKNHHRESVTTFTIRCSASTLRAILRGCSGFCSTIVKNKEWFDNSFIPGKVLDWTIEVKPQKL